MPKIINNLYSRIAIIGVLCLLLVAGLVYSPDRTPVGAQSATATFSFIRYTYNQTKPFKINTILTTPYGPAWADVVTAPSNMLTCKGTVPIALCYYSGPSGPVPCNEDGLGIANCTCYEIPPGQPYFVDINGILAEGVYKATVKKCGADGSNCKEPGSAPVCDFINNNTLIPGADLISTFSLYLKDDKPIGQTNCPSANYAGCMTAPCKRTGKIDPKTKLPLVQCGCPVVKGPYQVGQDVDPKRCELEGTHVWSAAYHPTPTPTP
jgi:hypothetical protein